MAKKATKKASPRIDDPGLEFEYVRVGSQVFPLATDEQRSAAEQALAAAGLASATVHSSSRSLAELAADATDPEPSGKTLLARR